MTENHKNQIHDMRRHGCTYRHIADALSLKEATVKTHCVRAAKKGLIATPETALDSACKQCGAHIDQVPKRKKRIFCSKVCREGWWKSRQYLVDRSSPALHHFTCPNCRKLFTVYANASRKYCSHQCYIADRYHREGPDGR